MLEGLRLCREKLCIKEQFPFPREMIVFGLMGKSKFRTEFSAQLLPTPSKEACQGVKNKEVALDPAPKNSAH